MTTFRAWGIAISVAVMMGIPATALAGFSGSYMLTITAARPTSLTGTQFCAVINDNGSVLHWPNSGTITISGNTGDFITVRHQLLAWIQTSSGLNEYTALLPEGGTNITGSGFAYLDSSGNATAT